MNQVAAASEYFERIGRCVKFDEGKEREKKKKIWVENDERKIEKTNIKVEEEKKF